MAVSFHLYTGYRFPVRVSGAGNKSKYVGYDSNKALILPCHQRAAVLQGICLRNVIQNLTTVTGQKVFPVFNTFKCRPGVVCARQKVGRLCTSKVGRLCTLLLCTFVLRGRRGTLLGLGWVW